MKDSKKEVKISTPVGIILIIVALITGVICFCLGKNVAKIEDNKTTSKKEVITEKKENETTTTKKIVEDNESDKNQTNSNKKNEIDSYVTIVKINGKEEEAIFYKANSLEIITTRDKEGDDEIYSFKIGDKINMSDDNTKYDLELFWKAFMMESAKRLRTDPIKYAQFISITSRHLQDLRFVGINKQSTFDMWLLDLRL